MSAGVEMPDTVQMETRALHEHLARLFALFSAAGSTAADGRGARMTALGFRKLVRAAQLTCDKCTDVDVDLIFQQVVRTRGARMSVGDMMIGLSMVAKRLYPEERTQSAAFHRILSETLLPWMLQLQVCRASSPAGPRSRPPPRPPLSRALISNPYPHPHHAHPHPRVPRLPRSLPRDCSTPSHLAPSSGARDVETAWRMWQLGNAKG